MKKLRGQKSAMDRRKHATAMDRRKHATNPSRSLFVFQRVRSIRVLYKDFENPPSIYSVRHHLSHFSSSHSLIKCLLFFA